MNRQFVTILSKNKTRDNITFTVPSVKVFFNLIGGDHLKETSVLNTSTKRLVFSALVMACYLTLMLVTASFAFGSLQIRLATALYALSYLFPFLVFPLGLANMLSNLLFGSLGMIDVFGGFLVGLITSFLVYLIRKFKLPEWMIILPITFVPGLGIPIYLHRLLQVPYWPLATSLLLGQIAPAFLGYLFVKALRNRKEIYHD